MRMTLTSYEEIGRVGRVHMDATRMQATFRPPRHVPMVWRVANMSATSRACRARGIRSTTRQTDKLNGEVVSILVTRTLRGNCSRGIEPLIH